jgi:hypothetical protein
VLWFSLHHLSETVFILRRIERYININVYWSSCKYQLFLLEFNENKNFLDRFLQNVRYQISYKSFHWETSCSIGRTDKLEVMTKPIVAFRNFANAPKKHTTTFREYGYLNWINYHQCAIWISGVIFCAKYKTVPINLGVLLMLQGTKPRCLGLDKKRAPIFNNCNYVK